jgi:glycosyltransferase involved in cell wall biosynthesis
MMITGCGMPAPDISIVVCTCGRPAQLERLLESISRQRTALLYELIVVNNLPESEIRLGAKFDGVPRIDEPRRGLSFARNAGIRVARAPIIVLVDDDIEVSPGWLEALANPILAGGFDAVIGPTIPLKLETDAERLFEAYGGHGHGRRRLEFDGRWLASRRLTLPIWQAGGLGNSSIRRTVFDDPRVGMMEEMLGVGSPPGSSEDLYYLYLMMRANYRILHEPAAAVRHAHRETMADLERQLCDYRRGEICFCLLAAGRHRDPRAVTHLLCWIPYWRVSLAVRESLRRLHGRRLFPFRLMWKEVLAYLSGPAALLASYRRVTALRRGPR